MATFTVPTTFTTFTTTPSVPPHSPILVLGGTGTVGSRIASQLSASSHPVLIASRNGDVTATSDMPRVATTSSSSQSSSSGGAISSSSPAGAKSTSTNPGKSTSTTKIVPFDWQDRTTWSNPFTTASQLFQQVSPYSTTQAERDELAAQGKIRSVYLIAPPGVMDPVGLMTDFVDYARKEHGVRRFVLQSGSCIEAGGPVMGKVHAYFRELGSRGEIEWAVLRPTWFQQNFGIQANHIQSIRDEGKIYSATGNGKIPWVSADDIAAVAVRALTMAEPSNTDYLVLGPELLSYDDVASILSEVLGKKIVHVDLTSSDLEKRLQSFGMPQDYSSMMSALDTGIKYGMENRTNDVVLSVTGVAPRRFREYAESVKEIWG